MPATDEERDPMGGVRRCQSLSQPPPSRRQPSSTLGLELVASIAAGQGRLRASVDALRETHLQLCEAATLAEAEGRLLPHPRVASLAWSARRAVRALEDCVQRLLADLEEARCGLGMLAQETGSSGPATEELELALEENRTTLLRVSSQLADLRLLQEDRPGIGSLDLADQARAALRALPERLAFGVTFVAELAHGEAAEDEVRHAGQAVLAMLARACVIARGSRAGPGTVLLRTGGDARGLHIDVRALPADAETHQTMLWLRLPRAPGAPPRSQ
jgi:hypothetical protein